MIYADTNFLVAIHFRNRFTDAAERFFRKNSFPVMIGELAELECQNVFLRLGGRAKSEAWHRLQASIEAGRFVREPFDWRAASAKAKSLIDGLSPQIRPGTMDILHVAAAVLAGASTLASFDTNSQMRVLAAHSRLKVFPELSPLEIGLRN